MQAHDVCDLKKLNRMWNEFSDNGFFYSYTRQLKLEQCDNAVRPKKQ